jgi:hypothetical protein
MWPFKQSSNKVDSTRSQVKPTYDPPPYTDAVQLDIKVAPQDLMALNALATDCQTRGNLDMEEYHLHMILKATPSGMIDDKQIMGNAAYRLYQLYKTQLKSDLQNKYILIAVDHHNISAMHELMEQYISEGKYLSAMKIMDTCVTLNLSIDDYFDRILTISESQKDVDPGCVTLNRMHDMLIGMTNCKRIQEFRLRLMEVEICKYNLFATMPKVDYSEHITINGANSDIYSHVQGHEYVGKTISQTLLVPIILTYYKKRIQDIGALFIRDKNYAGVKLLAKLYQGCVKDFDQYIQCCRIMGEIVDSADSFDIATDKN